MRKLFVALMAVLVLASCGGDKKQAADSVENKNITETTNVSPADVIMMTAELMDNAVANLEKAATADDVIDATAELYAAMKRLQTDYTEVMVAVDTLSEEQMNELYPDEIAAYQKATISFYGAIMSKATLMENLTPEQEARLQGILETEI
jgi:PBP1b-binding outer membrane lipoprotein LpoB